MKKLQTRIALYRKIKGMSRLELTKCLGCSYPSMMKYESGGQIPPKHIVIQLCDLFSCKIDDLFFLSNIHKEYSIQKERLMLKENCNLQHFTTEDLHFAAYLKCCDNLEFKGVLPSDHEETTKLLAVLR